MAHELSITVERDGKHFVESSVEPGKVLEGPFDTAQEALERSKARSDEFDKATGSTIFVEGIGIVELEGDEPNEAEMKVILQALEPPIPEPGFPNIPEQEENLLPPSIPRVSPSIRGGGRTGFAPISDEESQDRSIGDIVPREGPLGLIPLRPRMDVRRAVEKQPGLVQLITEMSPSAIGTAGGATAGGILTGGNPLGIIGGGMLGGIVGELFAQETGIAPTSELNLALSGAGPLGGPAVGGTLKGIKRGLGTAVTKGFPAARVARARNVMNRAVSEFESVGATILNKTSGVDVRPASELYQAASRAKVRIKPQLLQNTRAEIDRLIKKLTPISALTDVGQSLKALEQVSKVLLSNPKGVLLEEFIEARGFIGAIIGGLQKKGGSKLNISKRVFAVMNDDLEKISRSPFRKGRQARLAQTAIKRAKLEFAVQRMQDKVAQFTQRNVRGLKPDDVVINFKSLGKWLDDVTNPLRKAKFDKNFTDALKEHLPELKKRVDALAQMGATGSPGGPGSIVLRGQTAKIGRSLVGGALGFLGTGGTAVGAALGGLAGAQGPELIVAVLTTKTGATLLEAAAKAGKGTISHRAWLTASEIAFRSLGETKSGKGGVIRDFADIPDSEKTEKKKKSKTSPRGGGARGGGRTGRKSKSKSKPKKAVVKPKETSSGEVTISKRTRKHLPADFEVGP